MVERSSDHHGRERGIPSSLSRPFVDPDAASLMPEGQLVATPERVELHVVSKDQVLPFVCWGCNVATWCIV